MRLEAFLALPLPPIGGPQTPVILIQRLFDTACGTCLSFLDNNSTHELNDLSPTPRPARRNESLDDQQSRAGASMAPSCFRDSRTGWASTASLLLAASRPSPLLLVIDGPLGGPLIVSLRLAAGRPLHVDTLSLRGTGCRSRLRFASSLGSRSVGLVLALK